MLFQVIIIILVDMLIEQKPCPESLIRSAFHSFQKHIFSFTDLSLVCQHSKSLEQIIPTVLLLICKHLMLQSCSLIQQCADQSSNYLLDQAHDIILFVLHINPV